MFGDLLGESFFILEHNRDNPGAGLEWGAAYAAKLFEALKIEDAFVDDWVAVFFAVGLIVGC